MLLLSGICIVYEIKVEVTTDLSAVAYDNIKKASHGIDIQLTIVYILHIAVFGVVGVKVGHQGRYVLGGRQPAVDVVASVDEAPRGYGDVPDKLAVEGELKLQPERL